MGRSIAVTIAGNPRYFLGELKQLHGSTESKHESAWRKITIKNQQVYVFSGSEKEPKEIKPGQFQIKRHLTNAVIFAINSGNDNEGRWVETWVLAITQKNQSTLIANFVRVVNNLDLPPGNDHGQFSLAYAGEMQRKR